MCEKEYVGETARTFGVHFQFHEHTAERPPTSSAIQEHTKATGHKFSLDTQMEGHPTSSAIQGHTKANGHKFSLDTQMEGHPTT